MKQGKNIQDGDCGQLDLRSAQIIKALSRTVRKDYENYVLNAVWNRIYSESKNWTLKNGEKFYLKPEGQRRFDCLQDHNDRDVNFVDLFFPQLNIGIECDEPYHDRRKEEDELRDLAIIQERQMQQYAEFGDLNEKYPYKACRIKIKECKNLDQLHKEIEEKAVKFLAKRYQQMREDGDILKNWRILDAEQYYINRDKISVDDDYVAFRTNLDALNIVLDSDYSFISGAYGFCQYAKNHKSPNFTTWFPVLSYAIPADKFEKQSEEIKGKHLHGNKRKLRNAIKIDERSNYYFIKNNDFLNMRLGDIIYEWCPKKTRQKHKSRTFNIDRDKKPHPRIAFGKQFNALTGQSECRFIGVYLPTNEKCHSNGKIQHRIRVYRRIDKEFPICKPGQVEKFQNDVRQKIKQWQEKYPEIPLYPEDMNFYCEQ